MYTVRPLLDAGPGYIMERLLVISMFPLAISLKLGIALVMAPG